MIGVDNCPCILYNKNIRKKERIKMKYFEQIIAEEMQTGLTIESDQIKDIGRVLIERDYSSQRRNYLMNDPDFIPDILSNYNNSG
jgi:hypothetical protein